MVQKCQSELPPCERDATHLLRLFDELFYCCEQCGTEFVEENPYNASMSVMTGDPQQPREDT